MQTIVLTRPDTSIPWGFRLKGGSEYNVPLSILKVNENSPSYQVLEIGDVLVNIGKYSALNLRHEEALNLIRMFDTTLPLGVSRNFQDSTYQAKPVIAPAPNRGPTVWKPSSSVPATSTIQYLQRNIVLPTNTPPTPKSHQSQYSEQTTQHTEYTTQHTYRPEYNQQQFHQYQAPPQHHYQQQQQQQQHHQFEPQYQHYQPPQQQQQQQQQHHQFEPQYQHYQPPQQQQQQQHHQFEPQYQHYQHQQEQSYSNYSNQFNYQQPHFAQTAPAPSGPPAPPPPPPPPPPPLPSDLFQPTTPYSASNAQEYLQKTGFQRQVSTNSNNADSERNYSTSSGQVPDVLAKVMSAPAASGRKPFTYTPGGIDLSHIRKSNRVKRYDSSSEALLNQFQNQDAQPQRQYAPPSTYRHDSSSSQTYSPSATLPRPSKPQNAGGYNVTQEDLIKARQRDNDSKTPNHNQSFSFRMLNRFLEEVETNPNLMKSKKDEEVEAQEQATKGQVKSAVQRALEEEERIKALRAKGIIEQHEQHVYHAQPQNVYQPPIQQQQQQQQPPFHVKPVMSHNNPAATVPSKVFQMLERKYSVESDGSESSFRRSKHNVNEEEPVINKVPARERQQEGEASKYKGSAIPSKSFKFLQYLTQEEEIKTENNVTVNTKRTEERIEENGEVKKHDISEVTEIQKPLPVENVAITSNLDDNNTTIRRSSVSNYRLLNNSASSTNTNNRLNFTPINKSVDSYNRYSTSSDYNYKSNNNINNNNNNTYSYNSSTKNNRNNSSSSYNKSSYNNNSVSYSLPNHYQQPNQHYYQQQQQQQYQHQNSYYYTSNKHNNINNYNNNHNYNRHNSYYTSNTCNNNNQIKKPNNRFNSIRKYSVSDSFNAINRNRSDTFSILPSKTFRYLERLVSIENLLSENQPQPIDNLAAENPDNTVTIQQVGLPTNLTTDATVNIEPAPVSVPEVQPELITSEF